MKKTTLKRIFALILSAVVCLSLAACGSEPANNNDGSNVGTDGKTTYKVGICNYVDDASLNQIAENIQSQLKALADENGVVIEVSYDNPNADAAVMNQIISNFVADKVDVMVGIATPVAMAMQAATEDNQIPIIFSAVSDPVAAGLVESNDKPGFNLSGTSDYLDTNAIMNLIFTVNPDAKKIGLLYDQGQESSATAIADAKAYLEAKGIEIVERTGTNNDEVMLAAQALVADGVDAVFTPSDNTIMKAQLAIYETFKAAKIPHYGGADSFALNGAFLGYGVDYANLGKETANMIFDLLVNGKKPQDMPVMTFDNGTATINTEICEALGYNYDELAEKLAPYCLKVQPIETKESF